MVHGREEEMETQRYVGARLSRGGVNRPTWIFKKPSDHKSGKKTEMGSWGQVDYVAGCFSLTYVVYSAQLFNFLQKKRNFLEIWASPRVFSHRS